MMGKNWKRGLIFGLCAFAYCAQAKASICDDVAAKIQALKVEVPYNKWPGVEHEVAVPFASGKIDKGLGGKPGNYLQPILQSQKTRLLAEAQKNDPDHIEVWTAYLATSGDDLKDLDIGFSPAVYALESAGLFRLEQPLPATLIPFELAYYYHDTTGSDHVIRQSASPSVAGDTNYTGYNQTVSLIGFKGAPIEFFETSNPDESKTLGIWLWHKPGFSHQCDITLRYDFGFTFNPVSGHNAYELFLAKNIDVWGRAFRAHLDKMDHYYDPYRLATVAHASTDDLYPRALSNIASANAVYQHSLIQDFIQKFPLQATAVKDLVGGTPKSLDDESLLPVMLNGDLYMVVIDQDVSGNGPLPDLVVDMYVLKAGKVVKVASINAKRYEGNLIDLQIKPIGLHH